MKLLSLLLAIITITNLSGTIFGGENPDGHGDSDVRPKDKLVDSEKKVRIAIVAGKASGLYESPLLSLLEVKLSDVENVKLLERQQIFSILNEHKLSLAGLVQRDNIIKAGKLLRADAFILLSLEAGQGSTDKAAGLLRIRIVETAHGIRLADTFEAADSKDIEQTAQRIATKVTLVAQKLTIPPEESIAIGIVDIHRVGLADQHKRLANVLPAMLSSRLGKEPRIIILEREDLKLLLQEKQLTQGNENDFLNSAVLIDGYLHKNEQTNTLEMKLRAKNAAGKEVGQYGITVDPTIPASAINNVSEKIIKQIQSEPPTKSWNMDSEAKEFYHQGKLLNNNGQFINAIPMFETAHSLRRDNFNYHFELFKNALSVRLPGKRRFSDAYTKAGSEYYSDIELAEIVYVLVRQMEREYDNGKFTAETLLDQMAVPFGLTRFKCNYFANSISMKTEGVRIINEPSRKVFFETVCKASKDYKVTSYNSYGANLRLQSAFLSADNPEELMNNVKRTLSEIVLPPELGGTIEHLGKRSNACQKLNFGTVSRYYNLAEKDKFRDMWREYLLELAAKDDSLLKCMANAYLALLNPKGSIKSQKYFNIASDTFFKKLDGNEQLQEPHSESLLPFTIIRCLWHSYYRKREILDYSEKVYAPFFENNDAEKLYLWIHGKSQSYCIYSIPQDRESILRFTNLVEQSYSVFKSKKNHVNQQQAVKLKDEITYIKNRYESFFYDPKALSLKANIILSKDNTPKLRPCNYINAILINDRLYVAFARPGVALAVIDMSAKKLDYLARANCPSGTANYANGVGAKLEGYITGIAVLKQKAYVCIRDVGLMEFDLTNNNNNTKLLTKKDGLPSIAITSVAAVHDRLWIAYGGLNKECGLAIFDPSNSRYENIFCSSFKNEDAFNSGQSYVISSMVHGPGDKLFFLVGEGLFDIHAVYPLQEFWGLWNLDIKTKELSHLWHNMSLRILFENIDYFGESWFLRSRRSFIDFSTKLQSYTFLAGYNDFEKGVKKKPKIDFDRFKHGRYAFGNPYLGNIDLRTATCHNGEMWARLGRSQLVVLNKKNFTEESQVFENDILDGQPVLRFISTPYGLIAIGSNSVGLIEMDKPETDDILVETDEMSVK